MTETLETVVVEGQYLTLSLILFRRFQREMPGLLERTLEINPGLAGAGVFLPIGTEFDIPVPIPRKSSSVEPIKLW